MVSAKRFDAKGCIPAETEFNRTGSGIRVTTCSTWQHHRSTLKKEQTNEQQQRRTIQTNKH